MELLDKINNAEIHTYKDDTKYRRFNNNDIEIKGVLHLDLQSGSWTAN